jgi:hypothetical protein
MNLELSKEIIDKAIEELNRTVLQQSKHFQRLSSPRDVYSIPQASFRLNVDRHQFEELFVKTGEIMLVIIKGKKFVPHSEIESYLNRLPRYTVRKTLEEARKAL